MRSNLVLAAGLLAAALATPMHAQHAGHGAGHAGHAAPAARADTVSKAKVHGGHGSHTAEHTSGWRELDAFHLVMMQVWHPAKEKGDLAPIRAQASALASGADTVASAAIPAACDTAPNRDGVARIRRDSHALAALVKERAGDAKVLAALRSLHDRFELVNRGCKAK